MIVVEGQDCAFVVDLNTSVVELSTMAVTTDLQLETNLSNIRISSTSQLPTLDHAQGKRRLMQSREDACTRDTFRGRGEYN